MEGVLVYCGHEKEKSSLFSFVPRARRVFAKREKETYGFELRFGDGAGLLLAVTLGSCFCAVSHDC